MPSSRLHPNPERSLGDSEIRPEIRPQFRRAQGSTSLRLRVGQSIIGISLCAQRSRLTEAIVFGYTVKLIPVDPL